MEKTYYDKRLLVNEIKGLIDIYNNMLENTHDRELKLYYEGKISAFEFLLKIISR